MVDDEEEIEPSDDFTKELNLQKKRENKLIVWCNGCYTHQRTNLSATIYSNHNVQLQKTLW